MKGVLIMLTMLMAISISAKDILIPVQELPYEACTFIKDHFQDQDICFATKHTSIATKVTKPIQIHYTVRLEDDTVLEFDKKGRWKEIEGCNKAVLTFLPTQVQNYLGEHYCDIRIVQVGKSGKAYDIKFHNGEKLILADTGDLAINE